MSHTIQPTTASFNESWTDVGDQFAIPQNSLLSQQILWNDRLFHGTSMHPEPDNKDKILNETQSSNDDNFHNFIERMIGYKINNIYIFKEAFIHKSAQKIYNCSNERLEFLGDSVINLAVADYVFQTYPNMDEGFMTKLRTKLVNRYTLSFLAKYTKIDEFIMTSRQINLKQKPNDKIMEDAFEAFIGSLYLDSGFEKSSSFVIELMKSALNFDQLMIDSNYKDILLRHSQKVFSILPEYVLDKSEGPPHSREFFVHVMIHEKEYGHGNGGTKKEAEQYAAKITLQTLGVNIKDFIK